MKDIGTSIISAYYCNNRLKWRLLAPIWSCMER